MSALLDGLGALADVSVVLYMIVGLALGFLVGAFPGITATMAVALAAGFTMTLEPVQGLAVLLTIYVAANFGDRVPSILVNTPGTPASVATTFDGYPMAKQGRAGLALTISAIVSAVGILASVVLFAALAVPVATLARNYFRSPELFSLVVFGIAIMIGISSKSMLKGILAGVIGLMLGTVGLYSATNDQRFTFGLLDLVDGLDFIAVIIGLFGIAELLDQLLTHRQSTVRPISALGRWLPNRTELKQSGRAVAVSGAVGLGVGLIPAAGGACRRTHRMGSRTIRLQAPGEVRQGIHRGHRRLGHRVERDARRIPHHDDGARDPGRLGDGRDDRLDDHLGHHPGPTLFTERPDLVVSISGIMIVATLLALALSLVRMKGVVKLLDLPRPYLWSGILIFCVIGTYATSNSISTVVQMLVFGVIGLGLKRLEIPAGPIVLGLILGPLAEENLARTLQILPTQPFFSVVSPIAIVLLVLAVLSIVIPAVRNARKPKEKRGSFADSVLSEETFADIEQAHDELRDEPGMLTSTIPSDEARPARRSRKKKGTEK